MSARFSIAVSGNSKPMRNRTTAIKRADFQDARSDHKGACSPFLTKCCSSRVTPISAFHELTVVRNHRSVENECGSGGDRSPHPPPPAGACEGGGSARARNPALETALETWCSPAVLLRAKLRAKLPSWTMPPNMSLCLVSVSSAWGCGTMSHGGGKAANVASSQRR
jgi:hypothetical protein